MFGLKKTDSCKPLFKKCQVLTLPSLYIFECASFIKNNPEIFKFKTRDRHKNKIFSNPAKTALLSKSVFSNMPRIYNRIPENIRGINEVTAFKNKLYNLLVDKCYYSVTEYINDINL